MCVEPVDLSAGCLVVALLVQETHKEGHHLSHEETGGPKGSGAEIKRGIGWLKRRCWYCCAPGFKLSVAHFQAWSFTYTLRIKLEEG